MFRELVNLANNLDEKGFTKEADFIDNILKKNSSIDDEERGLLDKLKNMFRSRDSKENLNEEYDHYHEDVPIEIKREIFKYWRSNSLMSDEYVIDSAIKQMEEDHDEPLFWRVKPGNTGYDHSKDIGWHTGSEEDGDLKVYYGEI